MVHALRPRSYTLVLIAESGERFADFSPYVASVSEDGVVAFQAALRDGGSGVFAGRGGEIRTLAEPASGDIAGVHSHPDINGAGSVCFYASLPSGEHGVVLVRDGRIATISRTPGPLGPTMNARGVVAFRTEPEAGAAAICTADANMITMIADSSGPIVAFHGLPVVNAQGSVAFRADLGSGAQIIGVGNGPSFTTIAATGDELSDLGRFPDMNDAGAVAFCAVCAEGRSGIFVASGGALTPLLDSRGAFESFRSALINNKGEIVFAATPRDRALGVYCGPDARTDRVIGIDDEICGSTVADLALNPVSYNDAGQIALRIRLADGRHLILRADPAGA